MKVLLINPPNFNIAKFSSGWVMEIDEIGLYPPVGLMYIASYLRKNTDFEIKILDCVAEKFNYQQIEDYVRDYQPDLVGVASFTMVFYDVMETIKVIKRVCPKTLVCVGGPHTNLWYNETIQKLEVDFVIVGEGEITFTQLAKALDSKSDLNKIKGLVFKENNKVVKTEEGDLVKNLDELPFPAFDLVPFKKYFSVNAREKSIAVIFSSRGCPFRCTYCDKANFQYRSRSVGNILDEIQVYYDNSIREFVFFDDLFNITSQKVIDVSNGIIKRGLNIKWSFRGRVDQVTDEMVLVAKKAGCVLITFGVEDCTDEGLRMINKSVTTQQVLEAVKIVKCHGIETSTDWIIGLPRHKTKKDVLELLEFAKKVDSTYAAFAILIPYYGTQLYKEGITKGFVKDGLWEELVRDPKPNFLLPRWNGGLSRDELTRLYQKCYIDYYYRPSYVIKSLVRIRSLKELQRKVLAALKVLGLTSRKSQNG